MHQDDLQPEEEHSIRKFLDNATKTKPNSPRNAEGYF